MNICSMEQLRQYVEQTRHHFKVWKQQLAVMIFFVSMLIILQSFNNQHKEIRMMSNSISKFYRDFDLSMLKNPRELKELLKRASNLSGNITTLDEIRKATDENEKKIEILQNFEYDKTGKPDLALDAVGGKVAGIGNSETLYNCNAFMKILNCPTKKHGPENAISSGNMHGNCFGFKGESGSLYLRLMAPAVVNALTIEHIPKQMSPTMDVSDAPKIFNVTVS